MQSTPSRHRQFRYLHRYIVGFLSIWTLFIFSFMTAWYRVSQSGKFEGQPFQSLTLEQSSSNQPTHR